MDLSKSQKEIVSSIDEDLQDNEHKLHWNDWKWQMRHCVHDLGTFEELLDIKLPTAMEPAMRERGIKTAYTIARAASPGMNITFARLVNNTQISGHIEMAQIPVDSLHDGKAAEMV